MKRLILSLVFVCVAMWVSLGIMACAETPQDTEQDAVERQQHQYVTAQPAPVFEWSLERHLMTELYKARNNAVATFSLTWDPMRGKISWSCASIGYPIPGGTQLTNPQRLEGSTYANYPLTTIDQAEPNGLYAPGEAWGTYVMCTNADGTVTPTFVEADVMTFGVEMLEVDGRLVPKPGAQSSVRIRTTQQ